MPSENRPVIQCDLITGKQIAWFRSASAATKAIGKTGNLIRRCATGKKNSAYGFKWIYDDEYAKTVN